MAEPNLRNGSTDPAVRDLQEALKALGYNPGPIDGVFGATTEAAVKAFQQAKGISADGVVGNRPERARFEGWLDRPAGSSCAETNESGWI